MFKNIALAATFVVLSLNAQARPAWYAGADVGSTDMHGYAQHGTSIGVVGGVEFNRFIAIEGSVRRLGTFHLTPGASSTTADQYTIAGLWSAPLSEAFGLYARTGLSLHNIRGPQPGSVFSGVDSTIGAMIGAGAAYHVTPALTARLEFQRVSTGINNLNAGLTYKF